MIGWTVLVFILILVVLIFVHELGHFLTAKLFGVKVLEFGIGFPPRLFSFRRGETTYSLGLIPLGGFTRLLGEEDSNEPRSLAAQKPGPRFVILSAGSLAMFIFPFLLFPLALMVPHPEVVGGKGIKIVKVMPDSPAQSAGLKRGDEILRMNGEKIENFEELKKVTNSKQGQEVTLLLQRQDKQVKAKLVPRENPPPGEGSIGVGLSWAETITEQKSYPPWTAVAKGTKQACGLWVRLKQGVASLVQGKGELTLLGPVGIAQATGEVVKGGVMSLMVWAAFLSINLGIINLLPIPALDGGRIVFVLMEVLRRGKRVSMRAERLVHFVGFILLISLIFLVTYWDILRIFEGGSLFK